MARLLTSGFETGATNEFNGGALGCTISSTYKRTGTYSLRIPNQSGSQASRITHTFAADVTELFFRFALYVDSGAIQVSSALLTFYDNLNAAQLTLWYNTGTQSLDLYRGNDPGDVVPGTLIATGTVVIRSDVWCIVQGRVLIHDTTGAVTVTINNTTAVAYSGDTQATSVAGMRSITFRGAVAAPVSGFCYLDDVAFNDTTGSYQTTYPGLGGVYLLTPTADGATTTWDPSTGAVHYTLVDDVPANTTDWIQARDTGEIDLFELSNTPTYVNTINLVEVLYSAAVTASGYNLLTDVLRDGTVNYTDGTSTVVGIIPGYVLYKGTPHYNRPADGTTPWGTADVDALQAGVQIL